LKNQGERGWRETREKDGERLLKEHEKFPEANTRERGVKEKLIRVLIETERAKEEKQHIYRINGTSRKEISKSRNVSKRKKQSIAMIDACPEARHNLDRT
jgi:hypothetical protein